MTALAGASKGVIAEALLGRLRGRTGPILDPNKPHPALDALKAALTAFIQQGSTTALPLLLQLLTKVLGSTTTASADTTIEGATDAELVHALAMGHSVSAESVADWAWLAPLLTSWIQQIGPQAIAALVELINTALGAAPKTA